MESSFETGFSRSEVGKCDYLKFNFKVSKFKINYSFKIEF